MRSYWSNVASLHCYEVGKRADLYLNKQLTNQLGHVVNTDTLQHPNNTTATGVTTTTITTSTKNSSLLLSSSRKRKLLADHSSSIVIMKNIQEESNEASKVSTDPAVKSQPLTEEVTSTTLASADRALLVSSKEQKPTENGDSNLLQSSQHQVIELNSDDDLDDGDYDDDYTTIDEQETFERSHCVPTTVGSCGGDDHSAATAVAEQSMLASDARRDLATVLRERYPGALTDYLTRCSAKFSSDLGEESRSSSDYDGVMVIGDDHDVISDNNFAPAAPSHKVYSLHGLLPENNTCTTERTSNSVGGDGSNTGINNTSSTIPPSSSSSSAHNLPNNNPTAILNNSSSSSSKTNGDLTRKDLIELSEQAETHLPKSVINFNGTLQQQESTAPPLFFKGGRLREYQAVAVKWLRTMYDKGLPAVLADESGLGRKVVTAAFISNLVNSLQSKGKTLLESVIGKHPFKYYHV